MEDGQAGVEHVIVAIAEVLDQVPPDRMCLANAGWTTPFEGPVVPDVYIMRCGSRNCTASSGIEASLALSSECRSMQGLRV